MPFPLAAAVVYGAFAGGGIAATAGGLQRLWRYLNASEGEQDAQDEKISAAIPGIADALARAKFGTPIIDLPSNVGQELEVEARDSVPELRKQLNAASRERYGKPFSRLREAEKEEINQWLADQHF